MTPWKHAWTAAFALVIVHCGGGGSDNNSVPDASTGGAAGGGSNDGAAPSTDGGATTDGGGPQDGGGSCTTTITAVVNDATGTYPLPNAKVYVPVGAVPPFIHGPGSCGVIGSTVGGVQKTGPDGRTTLSVNAAAPFDVVAEIGKWRVTQRVTTLCGNTPLKLVLPTSASQGELPKIAVATGQGDSLECSLHRMGLDNAVTVFHGTGGASASAPAATTLWASLSTLHPYDTVLLSCEQAETAGAVPQALHDYVAAGGYAFAEHYGYSWFNVAPFSGEDIATWTAGPQNLTGTTSALFGAADPQRTWLDSTAVNGLTALHELTLLNADNNIATVGAAGTISLNANASASVPNAPLLLSWGEPVGAALGRIVYADFHIGSASGDYGLSAGQLGVPPGSVYPTGCVNKPLTPAEKAFMYTLYEELSCP